MSAADQRLLQGIAGDPLDKFSYPVVELGDISSGEQAYFAALAVKYKVLQARRRKRKEK